MLHAYTLNELGRHAEAFEEWVDMQVALPARGWGRHAIRRAGNWVLCTALAGLGRWEELEALRAPAAGGVGEHPTCYTYRYRVPGALLAAHRGDAAEVRVQIEAARDEMAAFGTAFDDASFLCDLSLAAARAGLADLAREQAETPWRPPAGTGCRGYRPRARSRWRARTRARRSSTRRSRRRSRSPRPTDGAALDPPRRGPRRAAAPPRAGAGARAARRARGDARRLRRRGLGRAARAARGLDPACAPASPSWPARSPTRTSP